MKDDELSIKKSDYTGNQIKTHGYYYQKANGKYFSLYFFYRNGVVLSAGGSFDDKPQMEAYIEREFIKNKSYQSSKDSWGSFKINNSKISFECWYPSEPPLKAYVREGSVLNDTCFSISESYRMVDGNKTEVKSRNETYYYETLSPKPDSTNNFVK